MKNLKHRLSYYTGLEDNLIFMVPMRPIRKNTLSPVTISYTTSSDKKIIVPCRISKREQRNSLGSGYKVLLEAISPIYGNDDFYISDLQSLIDNGHIKMYREVK